MARANLAVVTLIFATWKNWDTLLPPALPFLWAGFLWLAFHHPPALVADAGRFIIAEKGRLPFLEHSTSSTCLGYRSLSGWFLLAAVLHKGPKQQQWNVLETGWFHSIMQQNYKQWVTAGLARWSSRRQLIMPVPLLPVRAMHVSLSLARHNRIQICPEQFYCNSGILQIKSSSSDPQRFSAPCSKMAP